MAYRKMRKQAGRGLKETSEYLGVSVQAVNYWERGINEPNITTVRKLAQFYGCSVESLIEPDECENESRQQRNS